MEIQSFNQHELLGGQKNTEQEVKDTDTVNISNNSWMHQMKSLYPILQKLLLARITHVSVF